MDDLNKGLLIGVLALLAVVVLWAAIIFATHEFVPEHQLDTICKQKFGDEFKFDQSIWFTDKFHCKNTTKSLEPTKLFVTT